jgi:IS30 family transposase
MLTTITYQRQTAFKVDAAEAAQLRKEGLSLRQIKARLGTDASLATISRAIRRTNVPPAAAR